MRPQCRRDHTDGAAAPVHDNHELEPIHHHNGDKKSRRVSAGVSVEMTAFQIFERTGGTDSGTKTGSARHMLRSKMAQPHYRRYTVIAAAVSYGLSIIFLLLVIVGNLSKSQPALMQIYFFRLDLSDIIPLSVTNAQFLNSIARSLGLHDWYQTGLFCYCEGYRDEYVCPRCSIALADIVKGHHRLLHANSILLV